MPPIESGSPRNLSNNPSILKHYFLMHKMFDFIKRYNQELYTFQQNNGYNVSQVKTQSPRFMSDYQRPKLLNNRRKTVSMLDKIGNRPQQVTQIRVPNDPDQIIINTQKLQKLALMQVVGITIVSNLDYIISEPPHCND